jgi:hypothetical protein
MQIASLTNGNGFENGPWFDFTAKTHGRDAESAAFS